jgi:hypothetical protein
MVAGSSPAGVTRLAVFWFMQWLRPDAARALAGFGF